MKLFSHLKTSEKISLSFTLMSSFSVCLFLILINITYFFIWYSEQKEMVFSSMNETYKNYLNSQGEMQEIEAFKAYLLTKDTLIIPEIGEPLCSPGVAKKIRMEISEMQEKYFYKDGESIYVVYSQYFPSIWNVKVFFDTTPYIHSQLIIGKIWIMFLLGMILFQFFIGKAISQYLLRDLKNIAKILKYVSIDKNKKHIICNLPENDEIRILSQALNESYNAIDAQTKKLKQFLTDVSHEFKTPLMVMNSKLDVLEKRMEKECLGKDDVSHFFESSRLNIKKMNALIESLFFLARAEEKSEDTKRKKVEMQHFFQEKILQYRDHHNTSDTHITLDVEAWLVYEIEEESFSILLDNLIQNAVKFSRPPRMIHIMAQKNLLTVSDNGIGIASEDQQKIFQKFYRKDTGVEWFWIGLSLVSRIVENYGWKIEIESELWKGTKFMIHII